MRNLLRLSAAANRLAAAQDFKFVYDQLQEKGHNPPVDWGKGRYSARLIDKWTRSLITWAKENGIEITLPEGWTP